MAGRAAQKILLARRSDLQASDETQKEEDASSSEGEVEEFRQRNAFDLLLGDEDDAEVSEEDDHEASATIPLKESKCDADERKIDTSMQRKANKKRGKSKEKNGKANGKETKDEDLDQILQELQLDTKGVEKVVSSRDEKNEKTPLLGTENQQLSIEKELKRIFGAKVVQAGIAEDERTRQLPRGRRRVLKKGLIVSPRDHWPKFEGGLTMEFLGEKDGQKLFQYRHSIGYQDAQNQFESLANTHDPNLLVALLRFHPYHVDTLLTVSELYQHMGEAQTAGELLEKALYALECAWHPLFKPVEGNCRLSFSHGPNKSFFAALFRFAQNASRRGCHRTALQCAKMLLSLDESDPLGVLQAIDYYALRAGENRWLLRLAEEYLDGECTLSIYPNFSFSLALAKHALESEGEASCMTVSDESSDAMLLQAIMLHPVAVTKLVERLQEKGVARDEAWKSVLNRSLFRDARQESASLEHLVRIFVERQHLLWKNETVLSWLLETAERAANIEEGKEESCICPEDWQVVSSEFFPPSSVNSYRHLNLGDFTDNRALLPQADQGPGMFATGEEIGERSAVTGSFPVDLLRQEDLQEGSTLLMLLRTLLPWVQLGDEMEDPTPDPSGR